MTEINGELLVRGGLSVIDQETGVPATVNDDGQLHVVQAGRLDLGNSTDEQLIADEVFTGVSIDTSDFSALTIALQTDVASVTNGLQVQYADVPEGDWHDGELYTIPANSTKFFTPTLQSKYMRIVYTNGPAPTTIFHIHTMLRKQPVKWSSHNIEDPILGGDDAELVKAVITGKRADGLFDNVSLTNGSNMKVSLEEYDPTFLSNPLPVTDPTLQISKGLVTNTTTVNKFGAAFDGVQTTATDIWDRADASATQQIWVAPTQARIHNITSTSTQDDGNPEGDGSGAQAVQVYGLTSWDTAEVSETVILNGTATVATNNAYVIIHRMKVIPVGTTYGINAGTITATAVVDGTITAQISIGIGQTLMAIYGIPSTQSAYCKKMYANVHSPATPATAAQVSFKLLANEHPDLNELVFITKHSGGAITNGTSAVEHQFSAYNKFSGPCILKIQCVASAADIYTSAGFDLILIDN